MTDRKALIDDILEAKEEPIDTSLRGNALRRATSSAVPKTLTAWEWEEYYRTHGRPDTHAKASGESTAGFWQRLRDWLAP
jgi:hypothetical protein